MTNFQRDMADSLRYRLTELEEERASIEYAIAILDPPPEPPVPKRGYKRQESYRDWAVRQRYPFTQQDMADAFGKEKSTVRYQLEKLLKRETIVDMGKRRQGNKLYRYDKPTDPGAAAKADLARGPEAARGQVSAVPGTGKPMRIANKEVATLLKACASLGAVYSKDGREGHYKITMGGKRIGTVPSTPSDHRSLANTRAQLRKKGLKV